MNIMKLPEPSVSFTIPSLYDETVLSCRIFLPEHGGKPSLQSKKGAIIAHPYAPLGGCIDDPVVDLVASVFLKQGFVVLTFNFRGAGDSGGRTSWTGKSEVLDYSSIIAFFVEYLRQMRIPDAKKSPVETTKDEKIKLIIGGYSYGSQIATRLADLNTIIKPLTEPTPSHAATEINSRAKTLAAQTSKDLSSALLSSHLSVPGESPARTSFDHCVAVGGDETMTNSDGSQPHHKVRKSIDDVGRRLSKHFKRRSRSPDGDSSREDKSHDTETIPTQVPELQASLSSVQTYYLLVSPLLPPVSTLIALPIFASNTPQDHIQKFQEHPSLAVFGGKDLFTSAKKLRAWCSEISNINPSFRWVEIQEASHFWHELGVEKRMCSAIKEWISEIESGNL